MPNVVIILSLCFFCISCFASDVRVKVVSKDGENLANAVVYLTPKQSVSPNSNTKMAIMDQVNTQFFPHILAVQKGTQVRFPNSDSIKHHVYSFSPAKVFELQLYKGLQADPLLFSKNGAVELGCNVHDWMLGYIFVVDTPYFTKTNANGEALISVSKGDYVLQVWHPRIQDDYEILASQIVVDQDMDKIINLPSKLLPNLNQFEAEVDEFSEYE